MFMRTAYSVPHLAQTWGSVGSFQTNLLQLGQVLGILSTFLSHVYPQKLHLQGFLSSFHLCVLHWGHLLGFIEENQVYPHLLQVLLTTSSRSQRMEWQPGQMRGLAYTSELPEVFLHRLAIQV